MVVDFEALLQGEWRNDGTYHADCPYCGKPAKRGQTHFSVYPYDQHEDGWAFKCQVCGEGGGLQKLSKHLGADDYRQPVTPPDIKRHPQSKYNMHTSYDTVMGWHKDMVAKRPDILDYLAKRGVTRWATMKHFIGTYSGKTGNWISLPVLGLNNDKWRMEIAAVDRRRDPFTALAGQPKYKLMGDGGLPFGLYQLLTRPLSNFVFVTETALDASAITGAFGGYCAVALPSQDPEHWLHHLIQFERLIYIQDINDPNGAGDIKAAKIKRHRWDAFAKVPPHGNDLGESFALDDLDTFAWLHSLAHTPVAEIDSRMAQWARQLTPASAGIEVMR